MLVEIPKGVNHNFADEDPAPCWIPVSTRQDDNSLKPSKPVIRCQCGRYCGIGLHHVHADGTVTASFLHGKAPFSHNGKDYPGDPDGCEWHVFLKLLDYDCGDFPPEN